MPKMKTKSGVKKRFTLTATGKVKAGAAYKRHHLSHRSTTAKRNARGASVLSAPDQLIAQKWMPYGLN